MNVYWLDLNQIISVNHVVLIVEYITDSIINQILIDPTYSQFTKDDNHQLIGLKEWPSERLDKTMLKDLLETGITKIDDKKFQNYLNSFGDYKLTFSLADYLLAQTLNKKR